MKVEIILAIVWMTFCVGERQQRSTVLTDESKRVLEQFDFSNFDKQEALNYIDRQRYENQIRGKRSHSKLKRNQDGKNEKTLDKDKDKDTEINPPKRRNEYELVKPHVNAEKNEKDGSKEISTSKQTVGSGTRPTEPADTTQTRNKRRREHYGLSKKTERKKAKFIAECRKSDKRAKAKNGKKKKCRKKRKRHYWGHWSEWSHCSVTCGRGRKIRSRKCVARKCITGELEMGEKACQLPACNLLTKLLGL